MAPNKTLIAYETKGGATEESARKIADVLRSKYRLEVDLIDLKKQKVDDCSKYQNIIIGGGVRAAKFTIKLSSVLKTIIPVKRSLFLLAQADAGDHEKYAKAKTKFVENVLANYPNVKPVSTEAFGGRKKILGRTVLDNIDSAKVEVWAEELGNKFK